MPNYITNRLVINGDNDKVKQVIDFLKSTNDKGEDVAIDFNKIIPMPESLKVESSSMGDDGYTYLTGMSGNILQRSKYEKSVHYAKMIALKESNPKMFERCIEVGKQYLHNIAEHGSKTWYEWCCRNWGTKWNSLEPRYADYNIIIFETAWSGVPVLIAKLAEKFPDITFDYDYADEDVSYNIGSYQFNGTEIVNTEIEDGSREAYELCFELGVADPEDYTLIDGNYKYNDDEE